MAYLARIKPIYGLFTDLELGMGFWKLNLWQKKLTLHYIVAIKKFRESDKMKEIKKITMREVKILKMVNHKNIIHLKESFRRKERLHLVFEFGGKTILDVMKEVGGGIKVILPFNHSSQGKLRVICINYSRH